MSARVGSRRRSQPVRQSMVSVSTDDRDSAAPEPPEPRVRGCVVVTKTSGCLVNAFSEDRDAPRVRTRPLCAMLCAMHSLAGGIAAPRSVFRLDGLAVATQESREGTIVAVLADPEADDDALATETRIVARAFAFAARRAVAGAVDADLLAAETRGLDESHTDATLEPFAGFHTGYLATNVLGRPASLAKRWLGAVASVPGVAAAHAFLGLAREERPGGFPTNRREDENDESLRRHEPPSPLPAVSMSASDIARDEPQSGCSPPDPLAPAARAASPEWRALRRRAAAMLEAALRGDGASGLTTETLSFPICHDPSRSPPSRSPPRDEESPESLWVTLRAFASDARVSEEASGTREPFSFRDAACVAAVSVAPLTSQKHALEDAFAVAREAVLADLAFPSAETHAPAVPEDARHSFPFDAEAERNRDEDASGSPTSPLERLSDASGVSGSPEESESHERVARVPSRSRRGTRVFPYEPSSREGRGSGAKASGDPRR